MTRKVASVHGAEDSRLFQVMETFLGLAGEMSSHSDPLFRRNSAGR